MANAVFSLSSPLCVSISSPKSGRLDDSLGTHVCGDRRHGSAHPSRRRHHCPAVRFAIAHCRRDLPPSPANDTVDRPGQGLFSFFKLGRVMSKFTTRTSAKTIATWDAGCFQKTRQYVRMCPKPTPRRRDFMPIVAVSHCLAVIGDGLHSSVLSSRQGRYHVAAHLRNLTNAKAAAKTPYALH